MFDVFYSGIKPNVFAHEQAAESIEQAQELSRTRYFWWVNYLSDYTSFDFSFEPVPWEADQRHAWASQWQKDNGTYLVPKQGSTDTNYHAEIIPRNKIENYWITPDHVDIDALDYTWHHDLTDPPFIYQFGTQHQRTGGPQYVIPGATDIKYVDQVRVRSIYTAPIYEIDHLDGNAGHIQNTVKTVRYFDNYFDTLKRIAKNSSDEFIWICSSVCDYTNFDFTWYPEQWQATMLHVFPSNGEKFGDTFYMHVPTFLQRASEFELLEWYDLNFVNTSVARRPLPVVQHTHDSHVEAIKTMDFAGPLAVFSTGDAPSTVPTVPLWREKTKTIVPLSTGASNVVVPRAAVPYIKTQAYDYPYIDKTHKTGTDEPLDIVFIDNGESNAEHTYQHLCEVASLTWANRIHRSSGVTGRVAAYRAAAELSTTPWFFAVFAKLWVSDDFNWRWQPDRLQEPKHYIFHAKNPVNGLVYGHQAMIAYNKKLVLENTAPGLDFTLDQAHEVVPILSGVAHYNESPWMTWRTAFRECIKLRASLPDVENEYRLGKWLKITSSARSIYSVQGAEDAIEYYEAVGGDFAELKKSYDWEWLASYAFMKRNLLPNQ